MGMLYGLIGAVLGLAAGFGLRMLLARYKAQSIEREAELHLKEARMQAETIIKEGQIQAKAESIRMRDEFEKSIDSRRKELAVQEERINQRETNLDRKVALIDRKETQLDEKLADVERRSGDLRQVREEVEKLVESQRQKLQQVAGMSQEDARKSLLTAMEKEINNEVGGMIRRAQESAKESAEREAARIVATAIQRFSGSHANELMTSTVVLPGEEMKGRIIGRDGRNIRALEAATGVSILIDDTPDAVVISGFDPIRREIARQSLEFLISDGRIHPARIEEIVAKAQENTEEMIRAAGEKALYTTNVQGVEPELVRTLGRLHFRTSYTQNVLMHSVEVAELMAAMAGELGLDVSLARRVGLFHDIGKALSHEVDGGHAIIGADLLKRHGEAPLIVNAVAAHHEEVPPESVYAVLACAGDAISSSRAGARIETTQIYIKRLEKLEAIAGTFAGVDRSYAIQAGRELRVVVMPDKVSDHEAMILARNISKKIESDMHYPGQIRVTVVRETRCVEYAH